MAQTLGLNEIVTKDYRIVILDLDGKELAEVYVTGRRFADSFVRGYNNRPEGEVANSVAKLDTEYNNTPVV